MEALEKARANAIKGVTATGQDGKVYTKEDLEKMNRAIDQRFVDMENEVRVKKIELDKLTQQTTKLTKDQIDAAISTINLAVEALGPVGAKKFLDNIFETLDGSAFGTKETVMELHKEFKAFVKTMDEARIAAVGKASGNVIPDLPPPPPGPPTSQELDAIADGPEKIANRRASQGFAPGKSREEREAQLAKDAEIINKLYEDAAELKYQKMMQEATNEYEYQQRLSELDSTKTRDNYQLVKISLLKDLGLDTTGLDPKSSDWISWVDESVAQERATIGSIEKSMLSLYGSMGGIVPKYMASGGFAKGTDTVPAMLTPGEFIVNRKATQTFGPLLSAINSPTFKTPASSNPNFSGINSSNSITSTNNSKTLYNYNLSVNVSNSNANPNDIARTVIDQIRQIDNQRIRSL